MAIISIDDVTGYDPDPVGEGDSRAWELSFSDEDGVSVTPNTGTITWTLTDDSGTVINSRSSVSVDSAASVMISVSGADTTVDSGVLAELVNRRLLVTWQYDSTLGNNRVGRYEIRFQIKNFVGV